MLEPTSKQIEYIENTLDVCRSVWNFALAHRKDWCKSRKSSVNACSIDKEYIISVDEPFPNYHRQAKLLTEAKKNNDFLKSANAQVLQEEEDSEERYTKPNQLTIITMHKAKGLDWDYVFLPFLHEDVLPGKPWVPTAAKFLGDFALSEVARAQIRAAVHRQYMNEEMVNKIPEPETAWNEAAQLKKAEEYRLLYVAMTRAKRLLWMSAAHLGPFRWNIVQGNETMNLQTKMPCPVIPILKAEFPQSMMS
ncbi:MAG: helix-turn-helix domain-containing protein [Symploca sp. SIO1C4]|uniref:Helix-turn-helix domain-containing protein n=1 Tax=Symploca sp. SIO1C4 TaxID=2607765 RepID=A0A6B3NB60_9CYAN|nr:helix-turn-helix domain-containing protein [Symploca sp. SIO1C4]